jgi:anti-sigma regulatory factor (Ser/Thr protein kinase)
MIEIKISSDPKFLTIVRAMVGKVCELVECSVEEKNKIILAVDEACSNIMKHTYHGDLGQSIEIRCESARDKIEFVLKDCGPPIDPGKIKPRPLDDLRPGGLGTHFIRTIMDEVKYEHVVGCGNTLRMVKFLHRNNLGDLN